MAAATETVKKIEVFTADAQKAMTESLEKATKSLEDMTAFGHETVDAMVKSQNIATKAVEEFNAELVAFTKKTIEETVAHAKDLASAQTVTEFFEKQAGYAKISFDAMVKESAKLNELAVAAVKSAFEPINARVAAAADMAKAYRA